MQNNIKRDYFWNTLGVFAQSAISPLLLIIITRINGIGASGYFSFAFSLAIVFWAFGMWGGRTYQVSDTGSEFAQRSYIAVRLLLAVAMIVFAAIFSLLNQYDPAKVYIILTLVTLKAIESVADSIYGILQIHNRLFIAGKSLICKAVLGLGMFIIVDCLTNNILLASVSILIINIVGVLIYDFPMAKKVENIDFKWKSSGSRYFKDAFIIMRRCIAVFAITLLAAFPLNIPRYFIDLYHGGDIGYFGILAMPITLIVLLMSFIMQPNIVELSVFYSEHRYKEFCSIIMKIIMVTGLISLVTILVAYIIGVPLLNIVFGVNFNNYKDVLIVMLIGGTANAFVSIFMNILTIMRHFKTQIYILFLSNVGLLILSAFIIKQYGLISGAWLFMISSVVQAISLFCIYKKYLKKVLL